MYTRLGRGEASETLERFELDGCCPCIGGGGGGAVFVLLDESGILPVAFRDSNTVDEMSANISSQLVPQPESKAASLMRKSHRPYLLS